MLAGSFSRCVRNNTPMTSREIGERKPESRPRVQRQMSMAHYAAASHDRQGQPRESGGRGQARLRIYRQPATAAPGIAEAVDALAAKTLPGFRLSVKWGMSYYGVGDGWCFSCGGFAGHAKLMFGNGAALKPVPLVTPVGIWASRRGVRSSDPWTTSTNARSRHG
jgi:hypothetical protein